MDTAIHPVPVVQGPLAPASAMKRLRWAWPVAIIVGIPIGGYAANIIIGKVDSVGPALVGGLIAGAIIGAAQWLALRSIVPWLWLVATSVGMAAGLTAGAALVDYGISRADLVGSRESAGLGAGLVRDHVRDHEERQGALRSLRRQRSTRLRAADLASPDVLVPAQRA